MGEDEGKLVDKIQCLTDIELAVLLCLITGQHCIIEADGAELDRVGKELRLVSESYFFFLSWGKSCFFALLRSYISFPASFPVPKFHASCAVTCMLLFPAPRVPYHNSLISPKQT